MRCTGCVGTGFSFAVRRALRNALDQITRETSPLDARAPAAVERWARWVDPVFVADVEYREMTGEGILRHPSFRGIRPDRSPHDVGWPG
ncbi:ATP dependent DNA ligase [Nocardia sp. NPDC004573]